MTEAVVLLSICIPTFNRGEYLRRTLQSIVEQEAFLQTHEIEIVVSDNCSTDTTQEVGTEYANAYPGKVFYHRNQSNIGADINFETALTKGRGLFLKLHNDNLLIRNGSLTEMLKVIEATQNERPVIFFTNGSMNKGQQIEVCANFNAFVKAVSYYSTWIGGFGIWRKDFESIEGFAANAHLRIIQTDIIFRLVASGKRAIVLFDSYFIGLNSGRKSGYNIAEVFGRNYLILLKKYIASGQLSMDLYEFEKQSLLINHIIPYYFSSEHDFDKTGFFRYLKDDYDIDYLLHAVESHFKKDKASTDPIAENRRQLSEVWRLRNPHNDTKLGTISGGLNLNSMSVGRKTYGTLCVWAFGQQGEELRIGNFVSIAEDVKFLLGGNHPYTGVSTFPFRSKYFGHNVEAQTKGPIVIGDDVWIGFNSTILSGVTIGQGAVIAAGSMVTSSVAPYSIVGGSPATHRRFRFSKEIIQKLMGLDFSRVSDQAIIENGDILYDHLTDENVDEVIHKLMND